MVKSQETERKTCSFSCKFQVKCLRLLHKYYYSRLLLLLFLGIFIASPTKYENTDNNCPRQWDNNPKYGSS